MNTKYCKYYLFIILLLGLPLVVEGQQGIEIPKAERLELFTDRDLYIAGENIHFAAFVTNHALPGLSNIVYAEIIEPDGTQIAGAKYLLIHGAAHGCLTIPPHIFTGNYYLRVYTKYMRNVGPRSFAYVRLKIINPYKKEALSGKGKLPDTSWKISSKPSDSVTNHSRQGLSKIVYAEIIRPDSTEVTGAKFPLAHGATHKGMIIPFHIFTGNYYLKVYSKYMSNVGSRSFAHGIKIVTGKRTYLTREKANVTLKSNRIQTGKAEKLCVAVIPELAIPNKEIPMHSLSTKVNIVNFYPENRGLSITGTLQDSITKKREAGATINLSILGKGKIFMAIKTDRNGHFFFALPNYTGNRDLFLEPQNTQTTHPKILINNDFSVAPIQLPDPVFKMDSSERSVAFHMAQNFWVKQLFYSNSHSCNKKDSTSVYAFYGKPYYTLKLDQYIQLPTLEAYFENISPLVKIRKRQGKKYLKIISELPEMSYLPPLILVNGVAVNATEKILAASPRAISRIEVITVPYAMGKILYGGIINFITKKNGDFAGIDLPSSGMFLNYSFLHNNCNCAIITPDSVSQPDTRNTLYWNPDILLNSGKEIHFSFKTPDTPGKYAIVIQGVGSDGKPFMEKDIIEVKSKH